MYYIILRNLSIGRQTAGYKTFKIKEETLAKIWALKHYIKKKKKKKKNYLWSIILLKLLCNIPSEGCVTVYFLVSLLVGQVTVFHSYKQLCCNLCCSAAQSCLTLCDPMDCTPAGSCTPSCPWDSLGKNTGVGCHSLLQGIFPTQRSDPCLLHWEVSSLPLSHQRSPCLETFASVLIIS